MDVNWAMCRNSMCANFGIGFEGEIPEGIGEVSNGLYTVRVRTDPQGRVTAEIEYREGRHERRGIRWSPAGISQRTEGNRHITKRIWAAVAILILSSTSEGNDVTGLLGIWSGNASGGTKIALTVTDIDPNGRVAGTICRKMADGSVFGLTFSPRTSFTASRFE